VRLNRVDADFLGIFGIDVTAGRAFEAGDTNPPVVVNRTLAERMGGGALGQLIRIGAPGQETGGWREIVGIVADHPQNADGARVYAAQAGVPTRQLVSLRLQAGSSNIAARLPEIVSGVDSSLYVTNVRSLADVYRQIEIGNSVQFVALAAVMLSVVLLSVSGVYALLSFTVNRRRHEIGIRSALGAQAERIVFSVFRRALSQVAVGALLGLAASALLDYAIPMEPFGGRSVSGILPIVAVTIVLIACLAALAPVRRALKVSPTDALREIG
jgi:putative ABC transport system permease protein